LSTTASSTTKLRVLHVIAQLPVGGAEVMLQKLLSRCDRERFDFAVITLSRNKGVLAPSFEEMGVPVFSAGMGRVPGPLSFLKLIKLIRAWRPDVVQGWMPHGNLAALTARRFARKPPVILSIRQSLHDLMSDRPLTRAIIRRVGRLSRRAARIVYNSHIGADQHEALGYDKTRRLVLPNGFDCEAFKPDPTARNEFRSKIGVSHGDLLIGLVGRLDPIKEHAMFLRAGAQICREFLQAKLVCVGDGPEGYRNELVALAKDLGIAEKVIWTGSRKDIARVNNGLDVAVSASFSEGFCNAIGEAMACGVPCVVTDVGESARVVGDTGKVVLPKNTQSFASACCELLALSPGRRMELGRQARERILQHYELQRIAEQYQDLYRSVLHGAAV
jgi:glycosyltransferase involved in cell wall biosynthesis